MLKKELTAVVSDHGATPDTEETRRMEKLIGKPLTLIEVRTNGSVYLEFDPHGSITIAVEVIAGVHTSVAHQPKQPPRSSKPETSHDG